MDAAKTTRAGIDRIWPALVVVGVVLAVIALRAAFALHALAR